MKVVKSACVLWGSLYLCVGWLEAWSYNSTDTIESLVVLLALFVLPLPIALLSIRLPKAAGTALLACVALSFAAAISFEMRRAIAFADYPNVFAHLADGAPFTYFLELRTSECREQKARIMRVRA